MFYNKQRFKYKSRFKSARILYAHVRHGMIYLFFTMSPLVPTMKQQTMKKKHYNYILDIKLHAEMMMINFYVCGFPCYVYI